MTLLELQTRTLHRIDEDSASPVYYSAQTVKDALNEAQRFFVLLTLCLETTAALPLDADTTTYRMLLKFTDWLVPLRIRVSGVGGAKLSYGELAQFDALNPAWQLAHGTPERYAHLGFDFLALDPHPLNTGTSLDCTYARFPARMNAETVTPEIPEEYHPALADYAIPLLRAKEGGQEFLNSLRYFNRFLDDAQKLAGYVRARNKALAYDRGPFELSAYDRSRLFQTLKTTRGKP